MTGDLHSVVERRLRRADQRYTPSEPVRLNFWPDGPPGEHRRHRRSPARPAAQLGVPAPDRPGNRGTGPPRPRQRRGPPFRAGRGPHRAPPPPDVRELRQGRRRDPTGHFQRDWAGPSAGSRTPVTSSPAATASTCSAPAPTANSSPGGQPLPRAARVPGEVGGRRADPPFQCVRAVPRYQRLPQEPLAPRSGAWQSLLPLLPAGRLNLVSHSAAGPGSLLWAAPRTGNERNHLTRPLTAGTLSMLTRKRFSVWPGESRAAGIRGERRQRQDHAVLNAGSLSGRCWPACR